MSQLVNANDIIDMLITLKWGNEGFPIQFRKHFAEMLKSSPILSTNDQKLSWVHQVSMRLFGIWGLHFSCPYQFHKSNRQLIYGGKFGPFQHVLLVHTWKKCRESYTKQQDFHFLANRVSNAKTKKAILLTNLSEETYQLAKDLVAPA